MAVKTRKSAKAAATTASSDEHVHSNAKASTSSSSSTTSTINAGTHVPLKTPTRDPYKLQSTWNPIKIIERKLFRAYWNVEGTFVLSMLEAWEVLFVIVVFVVLNVLLWYSLIHYFPRHIQQVATRALYYVYGNHPPPQLAAAVTTNPAANFTNAAAAAADGVLDKLIASRNQLLASLNSELAAKDTNQEVVDTLLANLNKVKLMIADSANAVKTEL